MDELKEYPFESVSDLELTQCENATNYYYHQLNVFTNQNSELINIKNKEYDLAHEGIIDYVVYNYMSSRYELDFYHPQTRKFIIEQYKKDFNDPLINFKLNFTYAELNYQLDNALKLSKNSYNAVKWPYWRFRLKRIFCSCWPWWKPKQTNEYSHLINW